MIQGLLELVQFYKQDPLENIFIFTIYPNYTLALTLILTGNTCNIFIVR